MAYVSRYGKTLTVSQDVDVEVDFDDLVAELEDDEVAELYNDRFSGGALNEKTVWGMLYEKRIKLKDKEFLEFVSKVIEDRTGRIVL